MVIFRNEGLLHSGEPKRMLKFGPLFFAAKGYFAATKGYFAAAKGYFTTMNIFNAVKGFFAVVNP